MKPGWPGVLVAALAAAAAPLPASAATATFSEGTITNISSACAGQNAEVEQATDARLGFVYEVWMGCSGIGFARSRDGGLTFDRPLSLPGAGASSVNACARAVTVAP